MLYTTKLIRLVTSDRSYILLHSPERTHKYASVSDSIGGKGICIIENKNSEHQP